MSAPTHTTLATQILTHLAGWGFPVEVQQRLGAFGVVWGVFETSLESTLWALKGEKVRGERPSTDKTAVGDWIKELDQSWPQFERDAQSVVQAAAATAFDMMEYRHAIMHGWMLPDPSMPTFIRNPAWNGEVRKRPSHDAHVDANLLDMALDSGWVLCRLIYAVREACGDPAKMSAVVGLKSDVTRARSQANELRHLSDLVEHEKY